jgi:NAD(P)-dependent dehydrogenase (short-subunit alcohol dehydrogenase family)
MRLSNKIAIVTGGATGIGGATTRRLAEEGARVLIADINVPLAQEQVERIRSSGGTAESIEADAGQHDDIKKMVERAVDLWGSLRILVNNAYSPSGADGAGGAEEVTETAWDRGMAVLVKSMFLGAKYAVPHMRESGGGSIVNLSSVHGLLTAP